MRARRQRRLEAEHPGRRLVEGGLLGLLGVRGVVGGDAVDRAVGQAGPHRGDVGVGAQRRVHLEHRVVGRALGVGEGEVVGGGLAGDGQARRPWPARTISTDRAVDRCWKWTRVPVRRARAMSRMHHQLLGLGRLAGDAEAGRPLPLVHVPAGGQHRVLAVLGQHDAAARRP